MEGTSLAMLEKLLLRVCLVLSLTVNLWTFQLIFHFVFNKKIVKIIQIVRIYSNVKKTTKSCFLNSIVKLFNSL